MFTVDELVLQYEKLSEEELFQMNANISNYSNEARLALDIVISRKGGVDTLAKLHNERKSKVDEIQRIRRGVMQLGNAGADISTIKKTINSNVLSTDEFNEVIELAYSELEKEKQDRQIKPRTLVGGVIGGIIASIVGGIFWGLQRIYSTRVFFILVFGVALVCYGIIKVATKQSHKNTVVLLITIISIVLAFGLGELIYQIVGYKG